MKPAGTKLEKSPLPRGPFSWLPEVGQRRALSAVLLLTAIMMAAIHWSNAPLQNAAAPLGMISLQLAGGLPAAQKILGSWGPPELVMAALNLGIDYLYMVAYATTLSLGCQALARRFSCSRRFALPGVWLSWGMLVALFLDAVENVLLIRLLLGDLRESWATLALWCAVPKFALVFAALLYLIGGGLFALLARPADPAPSRERSGRC